MKVVVSSADGDFDEEWRGERGEFVLVVGVASESELSVRARGRLNSVEIRKAGATGANELRITIEE